MVVALALSVTTDWVTLTITEPLADCPEPVQVNEKVVFVMTLPMVCWPLAAVAFH